MAAIRDRLAASARRFSPLSSHSAPRRLSSRGRALAFLLALGAAAPLPALAYNLGDSIDPAILARLGASPEKVTVVDFFAEWCASCRKELLLISAAHGRADRKKADFVGVDTDDSLAVAEAFQKELKAKGAIGFRVVNDVDQGIVRKFKPRGYPALYLIKEGRIVREFVGAMPNIDAVIERELKALGAES